MPEVCTSSAANKKGVAFDWIPPDVPEDVVCAFILNSHFVKYSSHLILVVGKMKSSSLTYNRSWCHRHTHVKRVWSQPMTPRTYECAAAQSMDPWAAT